MVQSKCLQICWRILWTSALHSMLGERLCRGGRTRQLRGGCGLSTQWDGRSFTCCSCLAFDDKALLQRDREASHSGADCLQESKVGRGTRVPSNCPNLGQRLSSWKVGRPFGHIFAVGPFKNSQAEAESYRTAKHGIPALRLQPDWHEKGSVEAPVDTTVVLPEAHVIPRLFNPELGQWLEEQYTARGVKFLKGDQVTEFSGDGGTLSGLTLKSGNKLECNLAVVGIGAAPNVEFCEGLKLEQRGIVVDANMQTSTPGVYAVGDIATFPSKYGGLMRCENVDHARKSASQAVKSAMGAEAPPYTYLPYFYTRVFEYTDAPIVFNFFGDQRRFGTAGLFSKGRIQIASKNERLRDLDCFALLFQQRMHDG
eukprot:s295_g6.t1